MRVPESVSHPLARQDDLIVRELPDEVLIYDLTRDKAHCLNHTAALIWRNCDGRTSVAELARRLAHESSVPLNERLVWFALKQLGKDHLLVEGVTIPSTQRHGLTRRQMIRALGLTAAVGLPLITSIIAPTPAQASYGLPSGACCSQGEQCQSGMCNTLSPGDCPTGRCA